MEKGKLRKVVSSLELLLINVYLFIYLFSCRPRKENKTNSRKMHQGLTNSEKGKGTGLLGDTII